MNNIYSGAPDGYETMSVGEFMTLNFVHFVLIGLTALFFIIATIFVFRRNHTGKELDKVDKVNVVLHGLLSKRLKQYTSTVVTFGVLTIFAACGVGYLFNYKYNNAYDYVQSVGYLPTTSAKTIWTKKNEFVWDHVTKYGKEYDDKFKEAYKDFPDDTTQREKVLKELQEEYREKIRKVFYPQR